MQATRARAPRCAWPRALWLLIAAASCEIELSDQLVPDKVVWCTHGAVHTVAQIGFVRERPQTQARWLRQQRLTAVAPVPAADEALQPRADLRQLASRAATKCNTEPSSAQLLGQFHMTGPH